MCDCEKCIQTCRCKEEDGDLVCKGLVVALLPVLRKNNLEIHLFAFFESEISKSISTICLCIKPATAGDTTQKRCC